MRVHSLLRRGVALLLAAMLGLTAMVVGAQTPTDPGEAPSGILADTALSDAPVTRGGEQVLAGLSTTTVALTATFEGSEILVFGAVYRDAPVDPDAAPLAVIVTIQGPPQRLSVWRKARRGGVWMNVEEVRFARAPSLYAVATSHPLAEALSATEDLRHQVSIPRAIRAFGALARVEDAPAFTEALIRLRSADGLYQLKEGAVALSRETLFRTTIALPANLTEGAYSARVFLTRNGKVLDVYETVIDVRKAGIEAWLSMLAREQPLAYGMLAVLLAVAAGWGASTVVRLLRS